MDPKAIISADGRLRSNVGNNFKKCPILLQRRSSRNLIIFFKLRTSNLVLFIFGNLLKKSDRYESSHPSAISFFDDSEKFDTSRILPICEHGFISIEPPQYHILTDKKQH